MQILQTVQWIGGREWEGGWRLGRIDASTIRGLRLRMKIPYQTQKCEWNWSEVVVLFVFSIDFDLLAVFVLHSRVPFQISTIFFRLAFPPNKYLHKHFCIYVSITLASLFYHSIPRRISVSLVFHVFTL